MSTTSVVDNRFRFVCHVYNRRTTGSKIGKLITKKLKPELLGGVIPLFRNKGSVYIFMVYSHKKFFNLDCSPHYLLLFNCTIFSSINNRSKSLKSYGEPNAQCFTSSTYNTTAYIISTVVRLLSIHLCQRLYQ